MNEQELMEIANRADKLTPEDVVALINAVEKRTWRPIETAPKDGEAVLIFAQNFVGVGYFGIFDKRWRVSSSSPKSDCFIVSPTHWMALPAPPEAP